MSSHFEHDNFKVAIEDSLKPLSFSQRWDSIISNEHELHSSKLLAIELSQPADLKFHYIIVASKTDNSVLGIFYFQELTVTSKNIQLRENTLLNIALQSCLAVRNFKLLLSGNLFSVGQPSFHLSSSDVPKDIFTSILDSIFNQYKPTVLVVKEIESNAIASLQNNRAYTSFDFDSTMSLKIPKHWKLINDYRSELRKKYRIRFDKIRKAGQEIQRIEMSLAEIISQSKKINELFHQVTQRQAVRLGIVDERYFIEHKRQLGDRFRIIGYYLQDKLIAFSSYKNRGRELEVHYIGIDYSYNSTYQLYFNLLYDALNTGIEEGFEEIELGRTSREAKSNMGCTPRSATEFYRVDNQLSRWLLHLLKQYFEKANNPAQDIRHPFKSISG